MFPNFLVSIIVDFNQFGRRKVTSIFPTATFTIPLNVFTFSPFCRHLPTIRLSIKTSIKIA